VGACAKLLHDTPELIWSALEAQDVLRAALLLPLADAAARATASITETAEPARATIQQQRSAVTALRDVVRTRILSALGTLPATSPPASADESGSSARRLAALLVLPPSSRAVAAKPSSGRSVATAVDAWLERRSAALIDCLQPTAGPIEECLSRFAAATAQTVRELAGVLVIRSSGWSSEATRATDSFVTASLWADWQSGVAAAPPVGTLWHALWETVELEGLRRPAEGSSTSATASGTAGLLAGRPGYGLVLRYLPREVSTFRPTVTTEMLTYSLADLRERLQKWLASLAEATQGLIAQRLAYVEKLTDMQSVMDVVWRGLEEHDRAAAVHGEPSWHAFCQQVLGSSTVSLWHVLLREAWLARVQSITASAFHGLQELVAKEAERALECGSAQAWGGRRWLVPDERGLDGRGRAALAPTFDDPATVDLVSGECVCLSPSLCFA
jgi:hypothetical protein